MGEQQAEAEQVPCVQYRHPLSVTSQPGCMVKPYCMVGGKEREPGKVRSSSLPTDNKHSLVELLNQQKEQHRLFPSSLEKELVRCPPNFPELDRRSTWMMSGQQAEEAQGW